ncbi:diacylglyceryl transferase, partial [bacterium]|nr:diacylglyceryl transferase [bacterium]
IYEAVGLFALTALILWFGKGRAPGRTFSFYLIGAAILRFTVELFRGDPRGNVPATALSTSQGIAVGLFVLGLVILVLGRKKTEGQAEA